ncbi:MAG: Lipoprotein signal peptidase [uncultured Gemmatimonadetes bacterium]|uniref:Lipoprotein signal peptidase n=1 Tax=uncultured Gemmatimonadota bacterium TaxID=203437 RepID=A0A6J4MVV3_9BACT|nr:MAG: Lipoprotein signal peptidase [uncultured Gemmatimonadota bacterium]
MAEATTSAGTPADEARRKMALYLGLVIGWVVLDQVTKVIVQRTLRLYDPVPVIGDFFRLTYIYNRGAAFGLHLGDWSRIAFSILPVAAAALLYMMYRTTPWSDKMRLIAIPLVTGGAIGNLIDRIRSSRGVIDFFDFGFGGTRWPVFNVADIGVTVGALLLAVSLWREEQQMEKELDGV